jgi:dTDP-L-rhamnose 4-epimerase
MRRKILVTGGAGFVGSHLVDALLARGHHVRVLDNLDPQVHGRTGRPRGHLNADAEFLHADVRDLDAVRRALDGVDVVFHEAAAVGVGQSMYRIREYVEVNSLGGANLLQAIVDRKSRVERMIVASSMSIYGEGAYRCPACGPVHPPLRPKAQLKARRWELDCPRCGAETAAVPTGEDKPLIPTSIYAVTKRDHEEMFVACGQAYGIPTIALRYFNIYGPRQSLSNPYTGAAAIFSSRLLNGNPPLVFEDGCQTRDFVHVSDIVAANLLALESSRTGCDVFNVGTGRPLSILRLVQLIREELGQGPEEQVLHKFREGDIRHCYADVSRIRAALGYIPRVALEDGVRELVAWVREEEAVDLVERAARELEERGLTL